MLFDLLFDEPARELLRQATLPGRPRPLVSVWSDDDVLLSLPWELIHHDGRFLVRDAVVDLARSAPGEVGPGALLRPPTGPFTLVVNVSAPEGSGLDYEQESYRMTLALTDQCTLTPTELGTLDDLVATVARRPADRHPLLRPRRPRPAPVRGRPGRGPPGPGRGAAGSPAAGAARRPAAAVLLPGQLPRQRPRPRRARGGPARRGSLAARLHRAGVGQVVGYHGPILDGLSTEAEAALYAAIAAGHTTHFAVRQARAAMARPPGDDDRAVFREPRSSPAGRPTGRPTRSPGPSWSSTTAGPTTP